MSRLEEKLGAGDFVVTAEMVARQAEPLQSLRILRVALEHEGDLVRL